MENNEENESFLELDNKKIGQKIYIQRKIADMKAFDVAERLGIGEAAYTKYERGETKITIEFIKKISDIFSIDPLQLLASTPNSFFNDIKNSTILNTSTFHTFQGANEKQNEAILNLIDSVVEMNKRFMDYLEKEGKCSEK
ncbi:helix-turn-helix transcriptional regulator [Olivibacter sp. 47]|uniref:helix-turn-helix domain-containing protein n=1 Tax=Olivibacter sp. 47 TaxID=3056486 RepID=UPI0025A4CB99|nr:helix-turn-helix transcriptional regulator [Olivibacter sp. 47]MDM8175973.1 helix-turn-helix transcriptional regulator [Olivibacter sp. 47]